MRARAGAAGPDPDRLSGRVATAGRAGMPFLVEVAAFLDDTLRVRDYPEERNGVVADTREPVRRLGIALEPDARLERWVRSRAVDAVILHRVWGLDSRCLPPGTGVLAYHLPFDEHLTLGFNPRLAGALGMRDPAPLGFKRGRAIGMIGPVGDGEFDALLARVQGEIGAAEEVVPPRIRQVERVAVVGAMTDALVREAAARGAAAYLTGQVRAPARRAVEETGIGVIATGHRRGEEWGLRTLAALLQGRWSDLEIFVEGTRFPGRLPC